MHEIKHRSRKNIQSSSAQANRNYLMRSHYHTSTKDFLAHTAVSTALVASVVLQDEP